MENELIKITNDHKEKFQSWEAETSQTNGDGMGHYVSTLTGYGATEFEAKQNLTGQINKLIENLEIIKNNINHAK